MVRDPEGNDTWRSHRNAVINNIPWTGDCDDLVSTVLDCIAREGHPLDKMWRVQVSTNYSGIIDHMIGVVRGRNNLWVVGDALAPRAYVFERLSYQIVESSPGNRITWDRSGTILGAIALIGAFLMGPILT